MGITEFPQNVDLDNYKRCTYSFDTVSIKRSISEIDFEGEKMHYDYSRIELVDINDDGVCEVLHFFSSGVRGWPYDFMTIYQVKSNQLTKIFDGGSYFVEFAEPEDKWLQINYTVMEGHKTNPIYKNSVWKYEYDKYKPYYSSEMTKGGMKEKGLEHYHSGDFANALIYFKNVLVFPHTSNDKLLNSANDVAITLIKLKKFREVEPFLMPYFSGTTDKGVLASSYFNLGLAKEFDNDFASAIKYYEQSYHYNPILPTKSKIDSLRNNTY